MKLSALVLTIVILLSSIIPHHTSIRGAGLLLSGVGSLTPGCGLPTSTGDMTGTIVSSGETRSYILHVPTGYVSSVAVPLMISYHGGGETDAAHEAVSQLSADADLNDYVVAYPQGLTFNSTNGPTWRIVGDSPDVTFTNDLVTTIENQLCIDTRHIQINGISMGGFMAWSMACHGSFYIASIGVVAGRLSTFGPYQCVPHHPMSFDLFDGYADTKVPWNAIPPYTPSVLQEVASWSAQEGCTTTGQSTTVTQYYTQTVEVCPATIAVIANGVDGGHQWYGSSHVYRPPSIFGNQVPISMTAMLSAFMMTHSLP